MSTDSVGHDRAQSAPGGQRNRLASESSTRSRKLALASAQIMVIGRSSSSGNLRTRGGSQLRSIIHKGYFETLKPSELGNLRTIFMRVDPGDSGFVMMDDFLNRLDKAKTIDHFLKTAHNFFLHSISAERRMGFKSFRDIIALLLPTASADKVDATIHAGETWMHKKEEKRNSRRLEHARLSNSERMQKAARMGRMSRVFSLKSDKEDDFADLPQEHISLAKLQELRYLFAALDENEDGLVDVQDFEHYFGTQDDIRSLFQRQFQRQTKLYGAKDQVLNFDDFLNFMLPKGFQPCSYPDPDKVCTASSEQIFRWLHDDSTCNIKDKDKDKDKDVHGLVGTRETHDFESGHGHADRPNSATETSAVEHGENKASLSAGVSLPSLPTVPSLPSLRGLNWRRTGLDNRTLK